jgi:hypothetical protein
MTQIDPESIKKGVSDAFWDWIQNEHDITTTYAIQDGVKRAVTDWLDEHSISVGERIEAAVKEAVTDWLDVNGIGGAQQ